MVGNGDLLLSKVFIELVELEVPLDPVHNLNYRVYVLVKDLRLLQTLKRYKALVGCAVSTLASDGLGLLWAGSYGAVAGQFFNRQHLLGIRKHALGGVGIRREGTH